MCSVLPSTNTIEMYSSENAEHVRCGGICAQINPNKTKTKQQQNSEEINKQYIYKLKRWDAMIVAKKIKLPWLKSNNNK